MGNRTVQKPKKFPDTDLREPNTGSLTLVYDQDSDGSESFSSSEIIDYGHIQRQILSILSVKGLSGNILRTATRSLISEIQGDISKIIQIIDSYGEDPIHQSRIDENIKSALELIESHIKKFNQDHDEIDLIHLVSLQSKSLRDSLDGHIEATIDVLSGLFSRKYVDLVSRKHKNYSVVSFDLDALFKINNELGHSAGDIYIKTMAEMLKEYARVKDDGSRKHIDIPVRIGGDEFLILVDTKKEDVLQKVINRFQVSEFRKRFIFNLKKDGIQITDSSIDVIKQNAGFTIGKALYREGSELKKLMSEADQDMYSKKSRVGAYYRAGQYLQGLPVSDLFKLLPIIFMKIVKDSIKTFMNK